MIIDWLAEEFKAEESIDLRKDPMALQRLKKQLKKQKLSYLLQLKQKLTYLMLQQPILVLSTWLEL
ncbi:MAG: hypothetical protein CM15mP23_19340 [Cryomorphaceae bacterium]|nr:MAG: hypothetical protein CM15mP23_19340 [Cryomorphaceae bacterium]